MFRNDPDTWSAAAKLFHWGMALLIFAQIALGLLAVSWRLSPTKLDLFVWHKSTGMLILALLALRLAWRLSHRVPALPLEMPAWERAGARVSHFLLYTLMLALPLTGWVISSASGVPFRIFWTIPLPAVAAPDKGLADQFATIHGWLVSLLALVLVAHIGAALRHHYVKKDTVLARMLPWSPS
ncbi:MAG TPA: cytochrome b [Burkholderiales bacterium]|nr:cytochrome b [Burkholderiales bacterium]